MYTVSLTVTRMIHSSILIHLILIIADNSLRHSLALVFLLPQQLPQIHTSTRGPQYRSPSPPYRLLFRLLDSPRHPNNLNHTLFLNRPR